jgi:hypothetical protein
MASDPISVDHRSRLVAGADRAQVRAHAHPDSARLRGNRFGLLGRCAELHPAVSPATRRSLLNLHHAPSAS